MNFLSLKIYGNRHQILCILIEQFLIYHCFCIFTSRWHLHWWATQKWA